RVIEWRPRVRRSVALQAKRPWPPHVLSFSPPPRRNPFPGAADAVLADRPLMPDSSAALPDRHRGLVLGAANCQRRANAVDVGRGGEFPDNEGLQRVEIRRDTLQEEVDLAGQHVALAHDV